MTNNMIFLVVMVMIGVMRVNTKSIPINDPSWYFTDYNWAIASDGSSATSVNPGAYFKIGFSGASVAVDVDLSGAPSYPYATLRYTIDDLPAIDVLINSTMTRKENFNTMTNNMIFLVVMVMIGVMRVNTKSIPINDPSWYFTDYNWAIASDGSSATSVNPGAYFKIGFSGASVAVDVDLSGAPSYPYATLRYTIDDLPAIDVLINSTMTSILLGSGLSGGNHSLVVFLRNSLQSVDRWIPQCFIRVTGLTVEDDAITYSLPLRPKRMMIYWDSIGEGVRLYGLSSGDLIDNDSVNSWAMALAAGLDAELSLVAFGALGWTRIGSGNVPPVYTPGNDAQSSWNKIYSTVPRDFSGQLDYVICGHGTNDGLGGTPPAIVTASVFGWLPALRSEVSEQTKIVLVIPYGGFEAPAIYEAYNTYQAKFNDSSAYLVDLGQQAQQGLTGFTAEGSWQSSDGVHPFEWRTGQLASMLSFRLASL
eukprot:TRINITY_DN15752_c0_g1_i1.p1 TRINITY_DN15752_c0_g1~~TRINITY_DN15752_c0_g1_i1.p1  ORF type:complete len:555 (-),score=163.36 TRINITY_DN15752_c0_g1_i1:61-1494(-)